jgi:hypothetical protein
VIAPSSRSKPRTTSRRARARSGDRKRRVDVRRADHAGEERDLADRELLGGAGEVELRRLPDAEDALDAVLSEIDLVQVRVEDLVLLVAALDEERHDGLLHLAAKGPFLAEEEVLDELLRERRAALDDAAAAHVGRGGAQDADRIDAVVVEEAAILDDEDRARQQRRQRVEVHLAPRLPRRVEEAAHDLRLELQREQLLARLDVVHGGERRAVDIEVYRMLAGRLARIGDVVQDDVVAAGQLAEVALAQRRVAVGAAVPKALQAIDESGRGDVEAGIEEKGVAEDARREVPASTVQRLHHLRVERAQDWDRDCGGDDEAEQGDGTADHQEPPPPRHGLMIPTAGARSRGSGSQSGRPTTHECRIGADAAPTRSDLRHRRRTPATPAAGPLSRA